MKKKKTLEFKLPEILRRFNEKHLFFAVFKAVLRICIMFVPYIFADKYIKL